MTERLVISRLGQRGDGIADTAAGPAFVPYALPGETVTAEPVPGHPDRRHLLTVETASPERVAPVCKHFGVCGGCALQHWSLDRQLAWKRDLVIEALHQAGLDAPVAETVDAHGGGRRRVTLHARRGHHDILEVGFAAPRAHHVIAIDDCPILAPDLDGVIAAAWAIAEVLAPARKPLDIQATATANGLDIDVRGSGPLDTALRATLAAVAGKHRLARITRHGDLVIQRAPPALAIGPVTVTLPPGAFLQATTAAETILSDLVRAGTGRAKKVADLFCGVGPFALRLADKARVTAADSDAAAIAALKSAVAGTKGLKPVEAVARDLFRRPFVASELKGFDAVVFDPPRQGAEAQAQELARSAVPTIVAVSCDRATFARDARLLVDGGYRLETVTPVDQFRYSAHIEIVGVFRKC
jgi:23S rRNA (uracil1939-C5)-methyltransferase